jgi:multiple sugar transport system substrate-binding protein
MSATRRTGVRRLLAPSAALLGAALLVTGCSSGSSDGTPTADSSGSSTSAGAGYTAPPTDITATLTISNWGDPADQAVYKSVAERFKKKYPNVTVNDNFTPITTWTEYVNKLVAQQAAGDSPDIINIAIEGVRLGVSKDMFAPLNDYLANDPAGAEIAGDVDPTLLKSLAVDGNQFLMPGTWQQMVIYYNTKMFADAGITPNPDWTWDEFKADAQKLTTGSGGSKVYGFGIPNFNFGLTPWLYTNGTSQLNEDWTASNLTDPKVAESYQFVADLVKDGVAPAPKGADPYQLFPAGKIAMTGAGHWVVNGFKTAGFEDYDILPWPKKTDSSTVFGTSGFGISPTSENKDLAWEYIKELSGAETQAEWAKLGSGNPASKTAASSPEFLAMPKNSQLYYSVLATAKPVAAPTVFNVLDPAVTRAMEEIYAGTPASDALAKADQEVTQAFADEG